MAPEHPNETEVEKVKTTIRVGGEESKEGVVPSVMPGEGNQYIFESKPHMVAWKGQYESWYLYKGGCNPFSDTPEGGITTKPNRASNFNTEGLDLTGQLNPDYPDVIKGSKTWTERMLGYDTIITVT